MKLIGLALIVAGVLALALGGIRYTTREKVLDLGPIEATTEKHKMIPLSPIVGIAAVSRFSRSGRGRACRMTRPDAAPTRHAPGRL